MMAETESPIENLLDRMHYYAFSTPEKAVMSFIVGSKKNLGGTIERKYTYQELEKKTTDLALFLRNQGLKEGDRWVSCKYDFILETYLVVLFVLIPPLTVFFFIQSCSSISSFS